MGNTSDRIRCDMKRVVIALKSPRTSIWANILTATKLELRINGVSYYYAFIICLMKLMEIVIIHFYILSIKINVL